MVSTTRRPGALPRDFTAVHGYESNTSVVRVLATNDSHVVVGVERPDEFRAFGGYDPTAEVRDDSFYRVTIDRASGRITIIEERHHVERSGQPVSEWHGVTQFEYEDVDVERPGWVSVTLRELLYDALSYDL